jgi:putative thioredoxin
MSTIIIDPNQPEGAPSAAQDLVKDCDTNTFVADVTDSSMKQPVIVLFWAAQSSASKSMGDTLAKLVIRAGGLLKLVKLNVNDNPALVQQLQIQSVPTVYVFKDGRPIDAFAGVQSESQLQSFLNKLIGDAKPPIEAAMDQALALINDHQGVEAEAILNAILAQDSSYIPAIAAMVRALAVIADFDRADEFLNGLDAIIRANVNVCQAVSALELARQSAEVDCSALAELERQIQDNPKNLHARFALAQILFANAQIAEAIEQLLEIVHLDRNWNEAAGRKELIKIFDALGPTDSLTIEARKRLSAILFS